MPAAAKRQRTFTPGVDDRSRKCEGLTVDAVKPQPTKVRERRGGLGWGSGPRGGRESIREVGEGRGREVGFGSRWTKGEP